MQVSSSAPALAAVVRPTVGGEKASGNTQERGLALNSGNQANAKRKPAATESTQSATETTATPSATTAPQHPVAVFAEIWVNGKKMGEVDVNGNVSLPSVPAALQLSSGNSGPALARLRSEEIANALGGEVRYAGGNTATPAENTSTGDPKVDRMRAKVRAMYGAV
jgi:hypothetical protein